MTTADATDARGAEDEVRELITRWAAAVSEGRLDDVVADHTNDIVMFDVPPPDRGVRGGDAYRAVWPPFFEYQRVAVFDIVELDVTAGSDVAFAWALLHCDTPDNVAREPEHFLRLTLGLRRVDGRWRVTHEHHSFPDRTQPDEG